MTPDRMSARPCIHIHICQHPGWEQKLREITAGIEEEGIPSRVVSCGETDAAALAHQGALDSELGVGVGIGPSGLAIHFHKLREQEPLFAAAAADNPAEWRLFGYNAARLVKGIPFKDHPDETEHPRLAEAEDLYSLVARIVQRVLQETSQGHGR